MGQQSSSQQAQSGPNEEATWWCKLLARIIGCVGGFSTYYLLFWYFVVDTGHGFIVLVQSLYRVKASCMIKMAELMHRVPDA